jgi:hypothetical protein
MWIFEPHVAEQVVRGSRREHAIPVTATNGSNRERGVTQDGRADHHDHDSERQDVRGEMFIDATYEGDLMAAAGVDYHVGREAHERIRRDVERCADRRAASPPSISGPAGEDQSLCRAGDPSSGVLPRISTEPPGDYGQGDKKIQAYCYRYCADRPPGQSQTVSRSPDGYDPQQYELLLRIYRGRLARDVPEVRSDPNRKTDTNNHGPFSTDNIGFNYDYPEASYERRREILKEHETYQKGWLYFIANDPRVPQTCRRRCADGACRRTNSRTTAAGRTRSTFGRRAA